MNQFTASMGPSEQPTGRSDRRLGMLLEVLLLVAIGSYFAVLYSYRNAEDLILSYPFWWPDTFDWAKQAVVFLNQIEPRVTTPIDVWRPRDLWFLGILSLAFHFQAHIIILISLALTEVLFALGMLRLGRELDIPRNFSLLATLLVTCNYTFQVFSYYIMVDFMAITAMIWVCVVLVRVIRGAGGNSRGIQVWWGYALLALSSVTQIFTLIPAGPFSLLLMWQACKRRAWQALLWVGLGIGSVAAVRWLVSVIKQSIYGTSLDDRSKYLKLTSESIPFYSEALLVLCMPLLCMVVWQLVLSRRSLVRPLITQIDALFGLTIAAFIALILSYSTWQEARLLTFFLPLLYLWVVSLLARVVRVDLAGASALLLTLCTTYMALQPAGHIMSPRLRYFFDRLLTPGALLSSNALTFGLNWGGEDRRLERCLSPDQATGGEGRGYFSSSMEGCDPYQHYNLRVYWCYKYNVGNCFKTSDK